MTNTPGERAEDLRNMQWDGEIEEARARRDMGEFVEELERARATIIRIDKEIGEAFEVEPGNIPQTIVAPPSEKVIEWLADLTSAMVATLGVDEEAHAKAVELSNVIHEQLG